MSKNWHEIRDPIHVFIRLDTDERRILDSKPFQRLRNIHQLAMSYLVYPGATHKRFEHSLGVMELAGRVFDVVTDNDNVHPIVKEIIPEITQRDKLVYWRRVLRMAALCHDLGHLPFSHAAEKALLPDGWTHEKLTVEFLLSELMEEIFADVIPPLKSSHIAKLAVGPKELKGTTFSDWETILSEIIVGDSFGVDRIDYLLRDSYHAGVAYGKFDHFRLIDTLRILPKSLQAEYSIEPALGIEVGGLHSAEALLLARYFMYTQVYFHPVRRIYDIHLKDFLSAWLPAGKFSNNVEDLRMMTDNEVLVALLLASEDREMRGYDPASRIMQRRHYKLIYEKNPEDLRINPHAGDILFNSLAEEFGPESFRRDTYTQKGGVFEFPVLSGDGRIYTAYEKSTALQSLPLASIDYIFAHPDILKESQEWLKRNRTKVL